MKLEAAEELIVGKKYKISTGFGDGKIGICIQLRKNEFGHVWGRILVADDGAEYWVRWHLLIASREGSDQ